MREKKIKKLFRRMNMYMKNFHQGQLKVISSEFKKKKKKSFVYISHLIHLAFAIGKPHFLLFHKKSNSRLNFVSYLGYTFQNFNRVDIVKI